MMGIGEYDLCVMSYGSLVVVKEESVIGLDSCSEVSPAPKGFLKPQNTPKSAPELPICSSPQPFVTHTTCCDLP